MGNEIEIPDNMLVHCPKVQFRLAHVTGCTGCVHFSGMADRFPGSDKPFPQRYMVLCHRDPVKREVMEVVA